MIAYKFGEPDEYGDYPYLYSGGYSRHSLFDILKERMTEVYPMQLVCPREVELIAHLVNKGIDSHLEACFELDGFPRQRGHRMEYNFTRQGMLCLIRRMIEMEAGGDWENLSDSDDIDWYAINYTLLRDILTTLDVEYDV